MNVATLEAPPRALIEENPPTDDERRARHAEIFRRYDEDPGLKGRVCDRIVDIAGRYVEILKDTDHAEHEGFIERMELRADIYDVFMSDKMPVTAMYAAMLRNFAQRISSPHQEVRDAATLALLEFYNMPEDMVASEEKNYIADILRDLNDLGSSAYHHRRSLDQQKYEKDAVAKGLKEEDIEFGRVALTNGIVIPEQLPKELWSIDIPLVDIETLKDEIHAMNVEAQAIIGIDSIASMVVADPQDYARQYRAFVEFMAMHGPAMELLTFDALGGIAGRSTALRIMHEKLGHTEALAKADDILQDVADFGGIDGVMQIMYPIGRHNITNIEVVYPDLGAVKNAELKVGDGKAIDIAEYMDVRITYMSTNDAGEEVEATKHIIIRRKGRGSIVHKMMSGGDYSVDNPPADILAATEIVGRVDVRDDDTEPTSKEIEQKDKADQRQLAKNFVEELAYVAELKASGVLSLRTTVKKGEIRQPIFVQGGSEFKQVVRDAFAAYKTEHGNDHPLINYVEYKEKDVPFEVAKFMCSFIVDTDRGKREVSFEKQFMTALERDEARTNEDTAHVAYKAGRDRTIPEGTLKEINKRISRLSNKSLDVNTNERPDGAEKITGAQFWSELQKREWYIPQDMRQRYEKLAEGKKLQRLGNTVLTTALENYEVAA